MKYKLTLLLIIMTGYCLTAHQQAYAAGPTKKSKIISISTPLDELQLYNDTSYSVTIVVHDENNTYQVYLTPGDTFYKNARYRTENNRERLAKLLIYDIDRKYARVLIYRLNTDIYNEQWNSKQVKISSIFSRI